MWGGVNTLYLVQGATTAQASHRRETTHATTQDFTHLMAASMWKSASLADCGTYFPDMKFENWGAHWETGARPQKSYGCVHPDLTQKHFFYGQDPMRQFPAIS